MAEAVENYNRALEIDPSLEEAQLNLGNALVEQGKTEQGIEHIKRALQLKPHQSPRPRFAQAAQRHGSHRNVEWRQTGRKVGHGNSD